jgi:glycosyltransferase involved in cell wall biosynthesis
MKIGVSCVNLAEKIGGLRVYFNSLFDFLIENDTNNEYIFFFTEKNLDFLNALKSKKWTERCIEVANPLEIRGHLKKLDLYFCPVGILDPRPVPVPSIYTLADIQDTFFPQFFTRRSLQARRIHYRNSMKMADRVITHSEFSKDTFVKHYRTDPRKIVRIYLGAERDFYTNNGGYGSPGIDGLPQRYVFYPANRWKHKNHRTLLEAIQILNTRYRDDISLVLTGEDPEYGFDVMAESRRLEITDRVISLGFVDKAALIRLYHNAACLCHPSLFEGFGIPLVEAMACGCPVVCSNTTSIPEVVGDAALLVDPLDAVDMAKSIHLVLTDRRLRTELSDRGRKRAQLFSPEKTAEDHLRVFDEAAGLFKPKRYFYYKLPFVDPIYKAMRLYSRIKDRVRHAMIAGEGGRLIRPDKHN